MASCNESSFTFETETAELQERRLRLFQRPESQFARDAIHVQPGNVVVTRKFIKMIDDIHHFELKPDDVWIVTYPKCGTTLMQEMVWQIMHGIDINDQGKLPLFDRSPFIEIEMMVSEGMQLPDNAMDSLSNSLVRAKNAKSPRCIKTHMPFSILPPKLLDTCKVVYVTRNPKDCCTSFFHHQKLIPFEGFTGTFDEFAEWFKEGLTSFGSYWYHLGTAYPLRHHPNMLFLTYENVTKDIPGTIRLVADRLGYPVNEDQVEQLHEHLKIDNFRQNKAVNPPLVDKDTGLGFIRKGIVGDSKNHFNAEQIAEWDEWIDKMMDHWNIDKNLFHHS